MAVTGNEGGPISYTQAVQWINNFRNNAPTGTVVSHLYGKNPFQQVLSQPNCVGVRIYRAKDDSGSDILVIFGVDANGDGLSGYILENGVTCPPICTGKP